jgi:uncharacterized protein YbjT (DUF2867 family)
MTDASKILVTGATGYVGGRLIVRLLTAGYSVRALGRSIEKMTSRSWACHKNVELYQGDVEREKDLMRAAKGCRAAYYLVHAMNAHKGQFASADRRSALNMKNAASAAGLQQIIYLGGLGDISNPNLSCHLASRHEVGRILQSGPVPATVLRAAMILGSGSASFEILRYLVQRLPIMITPRWVHTPTQPIAISNVLDYLIGCLDNPQTYGRSFDIGGPDRLNYQKLIAIFAREAGLPPRKIIPVPVLTPKISALWIHLVTPVPASIALPLTEGLGVPTVCRENGIQAIIPMKLISCRQAIRTALDQILNKQVESCWSDAGPFHPPEWAVCGDAGYAGGTVLTCAYQATLKAKAEQVWRPVIGIGGQNGYYFGDRLWRLRGRLDRWAGGVGLRRGRRDPLQIRVGDALDFWRVLSIEPRRRLTLMAEMKLPGEAILDLQIHPLNGGRVELRLISRFLPRGLAGILYWYSLYPLHVMIFKGMLKAIARQTGEAITAVPRRWHPPPTDRCRIFSEPP